MSKCELCGEPMAEIESMFKFHGSLGPCPKPPLPSKKLSAMQEIASVLEDLDADLDQQLYDDENVRSYRGSDQDIPKDFRHHVVITHEMWCRISKVTWMARELQRKVAE